MWVFSKYIVLIISLLSYTLVQARSYYSFAIFSELVWLGLYIYFSVYGSWVQSTYLLTLPLVVLVLTAVEATVLWSLLVFQSASNKL